MNSPTDSSATASPSPAPLSTPPPHRLSTVAEQRDEQLAVAFTWQTDRYAHVIESFDRKPLLSSEGTPTDDWPLSPAISQLSTETIDGRLTVLGVGCSGTTHFSVSVQVEGDENGPPAIRFDWAARLSRPLTDADLTEAWLGSTYQPCGELDWFIEPLESAIMASQSSIQPVRPDQGRPDNMRTVQWSYRIRQK